MNDTVPEPLVHDTPATGVTFGLRLQVWFGRVGAIATWVIVTLNLPLIPAYAPRPVPLTIGTVALNELATEQVLWLIVGGLGIIRAVLISKEPFDRTIRLIVPFRATPS